MSTVKKNLTHLIKLLQDFKLSPSKDTAMCLGKSLCLSSVAMNKKKRIFEQAFKIIDGDNELLSIINAWAVFVMLEDDISLSQKILAVRGMLEDPYVNASLLEEWISLVWTTNKVSGDMKDFLAIDFRNDSRISLELKKKLF